MNATYSLTRSCNFFVSIEKKKKINNQQKYSNIKFTFVYFYNVYKDNIKMFDLSYI